MKIYIHGHRGRMGQIIQAAIKQDNDVSYTEVLEKSDVVLDFSSPEGTLNLLKKLEDLNPIPKILIGTTGLDESFEEKFEALGKKTAVMKAPNTSLGIQILLPVLELLKKLSQGQDFQWKLIETHHRYKKDSPSGTAKLLAKKCHDPEILSLRGGGVFGEHEIRLLGSYEEISITHRAFQRELFALGAIKMAKDLMQRSHGYF